MSYSPTVEIGRYQSHMESVHDRFIGYHVKEENCRHQDFPQNTTECFHIKMESGTYENISRLYAFQLDNDDGVAYQTLVFGRDKPPNSPVEEANETARAEKDKDLEYISINRIHMDKEVKFKLLTKKPDDYYKELKSIGEDNFYVVPMKTIGFRPCVRPVNFRKHGKLVLESPDDDGFYAGYWWDTNKNMQLPQKPDPINDTYEYYYYLHKDYYDS